MVDITKLFKDKNGKVVLAQKPNTPLLLSFIFLVLSWLTSGDTSAHTSTLARASILVWAGLELLSGVTLIRRLLGLIVIVMVVSDILL